MSENKEQEDVIKWAMQSAPKSQLEKKNLVSNLSPAQEMQYNQDVAKCLKKLDMISFNIFKLKATTNNNEFIVITNCLLTYYDSFRAEKINEANFLNFIKVIQSGYLSLPYHNSTHAADVVQAFHYFLKSCRAADYNEFGLSDITICLLSAAIHDYQHPGLNNTFLVNNSDDLALLYNDRSVLENHHLASSFKLLHQASNNFFCDMSPEDTRKYRSLMIKLVLATDFSRHFKDLGKFKLRFSRESETEKNKGFMMEMLMHAADVSNSMRKWNIYYE